MSEKDNGYKTPYGERKIPLQQSFLLPKSLASYDVTILPTIRRDLNGTVVRRSQRLVSLTPEQRKRLESTK